MLKEKMTQELQNVRSQSAQYQQKIANHESRIKDLQAGLQRLQGAEMMLSHLLQQAEQAQESEAAVEAKEVLLGQEPAEAEPVKADSNDVVVELKKAKDI